jgi:hypothetical protein
LVSRLGKTDPPFQSPFDNCYSYARLVRIPVVERSIGCDGILATIGERFIIEVRRTLDPGRKNFTVCHEVGHAEILRRARDWEHRKQRKQRRATHEEMANGEEEKLGDLFAVNLLMPRSVFESHASALAPGRTSLSILADRFATSFETTARRITDLGLWPCVFFWSVPKESFNGRLFLDIKRSYSPEWIRNPFPKTDWCAETFRFINDCFVENSPAERWVDGRTGRWRFECEAMHLGGERCVFSVMTLTGGEDPN